MVVVVLTTAVIMAAMVGVFIGGIVYRIKRKETGNRNEGDLPLRYRFYNN